MKKLLLATALSVASLSANAEVITTTGGVSVIQSDTIAADQANLQTSVDFTQWWTTPVNTNTPGANLSTNTILASPATLDAAVNAELVGMGVINVFDGLVTDGNAPSNRPICDGCQLSFTFGGFMRDVAVPELDFSSAWLNIYLDYNFNSIANPFDIANDQGATLNISDEVAKAVDGVLWLSLDIRNFVFTPDITNPNPNAGGVVGFQGDVSSDPARLGLASDAFVNDFFAIGGDSYDVNTRGFTAFFERTSGSGNLLPYAVNGSGNIEARVVSEPGAIALFSLGLIGLGLSARRRMNK
jgi:hypothetical protein